LVPCLLQAIRKNEDVTLTLERNDPDLTCVDSEADGDHLIDDIAVVVMPKSDDKDDSESAAASAGKFL
jgi:hypothetical protein